MPGWSSMRPFRSIKIRLAYPLTWFAWHRLTRQRPATLTTSMPKRVRRAQRKYGDRTITFRWSEIPYTRTDLINAAIELTSASHYLEIGCGDNTNFEAVTCAHKIGVDPVRGGTHRTTSDEYFRNHDDEFDVIFIDGLHEARQVIRDVRSSLRVLCDGGIIIVHDSLPETYLKQVVPRLTRVWNGDVWKAIFELKSHAGFDIRIAAIDHGCALILPRSSTDTTPVADWRVATLDFHDFVEHWEAIGIVEYSEAVDFLKEYAEQCAI